MYFITGKRCLSCMIYTSKLQDKEKFLHWLQSNVCLTGFYSLFDNVILAFWCCLLFDFISLGSIALNTSFLKISFFFLNSLFIVGIMLDMRHVLILNNSERSYRPLLVLYKNQVLSQKQISSKF